MVRILDHIRRINPPLETAVHAQGYHSPQPVLVLRHHRAPSRAVPPRADLQPPDAFAVVIELCRIGRAHNSLDCLGQTVRDKTLPFFLKARRRSAEPCRASLRFGPAREGHGSARYDLLGHLNGAVTSTMTREGLSQDGRTSPNLK